MTPSKNILRISEYEKLYYDDQKLFKRRHWEALCRYPETVLTTSANKVVYFRILNKGIQFTNYVGVIQVGNLTIEVLPKTDKSATTAANESVHQLQDESKKQWHTALLQMLMECKLLSVQHTGNAFLKLHAGSILDIYITLFLDEAERLLHEGLLKQYQQQESNITTLKGQLLLHKQVQQNSVHQERFYVRNTAYKFDNIFNCILYQTLQLISAISTNVALHDSVNRLLLHFAEPATININATTFSRIVYNRKTERYREAMYIAKMLLLNYRPDITGGTENVIAILFDMNKLWEEWVYRQLKKEEATFDITIQRQQATDFWKSEHLQRHKTIRPDIIITTKKETIIVDTKWKLVEDLTPDDEDLKQMFVYSLYWQSSKSILLYPANDLYFIDGHYKDFQNSEETPVRCAILTATIFEDNLLHKNFAKNVLHKILQTPC